MDLFRLENDLVALAVDPFRLETDRVRSNQDRVPSAKAVLRWAAGRVRSDRDPFRSVADLLSLSLVVVRW